MRKWGPSKSSSRAKFAWLWKHRKEWWNAAPDELDHAGSDLFTQLINQMIFDGIYGPMTWPYDIHRWTIAKMARLKKISKRQLLGKE